MTQSALNRHPRLALTLREILFGMAAALIGVVMAALPTHLAVGLLGAVVLGAGMILSPLVGLVLMLVLSPMRTLIETEAAFRLPLEIGRLTIILFTAGWVLHRILHKKPILLMRWSPVFITLALFFGVGGLTVISAVSINAWLTEWLKWGLMLLLAILTASEAHGLRWQWVVFGLVCAGLANALIGYYIFFGGSGALHLLVEGRYFRAFGTFGQPNPFGGFMGLLAPLALAASYGYALLLWRRWQTLRRIDPICLAISLFYLTAFILFAGGVVISWSRGAWLAFAVSAAFTIILLPRRLWQSMVLVTTMGLLAVVLWTTGLIPTSIRERLQSVTQELFAVDDVRGLDITPINYAVYERLAHWQAAMNMAAAYPWLGVGLGNYEVAYERFRLINWDEPLGHAHNYYLNVLAEGGIIGLSGYLTFWLLISRLTWRTRLHPDLVAQSIAGGLFGVWVYMAVHSFTDNLYVNNIFLHLGVMFGLLAVLYHQTQAGHRIEGQ